LAASQSPEKNQMTSVSVLLPCYNAAETLEACLDSLAAQTHPDFEVVAVDDGSSDATAEILRGRAAADRRIQLLVRPHGGIIRALNHGLASCRGRYVARMDADDRCDPQRLAKQAEFLDANPEVALVSCLVRAFPSENVRGGFRVYLDWLNALVRHEDILREIFVESPLPHPSVMLRRDWLVRCGAYQERGWPEDYDLWLRMAQAGAVFAKLPEVLLDWRERPERLTRVDRRYSLENFLRAKAHYLARGPLVGRDAVIVWGAGMMGRRLSKHLLRHGAPLQAFIDIDPKKIGRTRRGRPVIAPQDLPAAWARAENPILLAAVGARGARDLIRTRLAEMGFKEGRDWWGVA
jgi:glycosyltransferase involved in cell wall biosynthesis